MDKPIQKVAITGTVYNPRQYELRFEAISTLLSLFELREKIYISTSESSGMLDDLEDYSSTSAKILLDSVIQDSCNYVSMIICYIPALTKGTTGDKSSVSSDTQKSVSEKN